jgi:hypothetical protein
VIIAPAAASKRGWVRVDTLQFRLMGHAGTERLISLLHRIGGLYARGASSTVKSLDLWDIDIQGGGRLRLTLEGVTPEAIKRLGELFEVLATVVQSGPTTEVDLEIDDPDETCLFMQVLQPDGTS